EERAGRPVDVIVCWHTNRFSRSDSFETGRFLCDFRECGVNRMFTHNKGMLSFVDPQTRIIFNLEHDASNHAYSRDLAASSTRGHAAAAREGRSNGGPVPYGYRCHYHEVKIKGKVRRRPLPYVIHEDEARIVREIFDLRDRTDTTARAIMRRLNERG